MIEIEGITKIYRVEGNTKTVLNKVSLTLPPDKSVALIGRNGAGKSSLLKIISGLSKPNEGFVRTSCRISWPIGFAGSFHSELSGAQNARFVARVYGVPSAQVVDYVAQFSELGNELYNPVRTYSSGMRARLAFAVSMAVDFDYYLIDEVTSVGDTTFRKKCAETLLRKIGKCGALVVSHNSGMLKKLCTSAVVIENSKAYYFDKVEPAIAFYNWCRESYFDPDDIGDMTDIFANIDKIDPDKNIYELKREYRPRTNLLKRFIQGNISSNAHAQRRYNDEIERHLKIYASSGETRDQHVETLSKLAMDRTVWARIFPATHSEIALRTLERFVESEQWDEAENLSFFLFTERIDGAAAVLESLCRTFMQIRKERGLGKKEKKAPKNGKNGDTSKDQKAENMGAPPPSVGGRWLTLARAAARAHDANASSHVLLAEALLSTPKPILDEAQPHVERALELDSNQPEALNLRAQIESFRENSAESEPIAHTVADDEVLELDEMFDEKEELTSPSWRPWRRFKHKN